MVKYKQLCFRCKKKYVLTTPRNRFPICYDCQKPEMEGKIEDAAMKKMFKIPEEFYQQSMFLRDIKIKYLKFKTLSEKQIDAFKKAVEKMKEEQKEE